MATASQIRAGAAFVELSADGSKLARDLRDAEARVKAFGQGLSTVGAKFLRSSAAFAAPLAGATLIFGGFEKEMARVKALTNALPEDFRRMSNEAKRLGETTEFSAGQAAATMGVFALAGMRANDIIAATGPTLNLASTGMMDLAQAADISTKVLKGMGMTTAELPRVVDVLAKAMTTANTDLVMLGQAFKFVAPAAKAAGLGIEEVAAGIQDLSDAGMQADIAGTTFRGAMLSLTGPTEKGRQRLAELGVTIADAAGNFRGLVAIVQDFERAFAGMGNVEKLAAINDIFGDRQAVGIARWTETDGEGVKGSDRLAKFIRQNVIAHQEQVAARVSTTQLDTLWGAWKMIESAVEGVAIVIGEALNPVLRDLSDAVIAVTGLVGGWAKGNTDLFQGLLKGVVVAGLVGGSLLAVGAAVNLVAFGIGGLATLVGLAAGAVGLLGSAFTLLAGPVGLAAAGMAAFLAYTKTGQGVVAGMGKAAAGLGDTFRSMGETFHKTWQGVVDAVKAGDLALAGEVAMLGLRVAWSQGVGWMREQWDGFCGYFTKAFEDATTVIARAMNMLTADLERLATHARRSVDVFAALGIGGPGIAQRLAGMPAVDKEMADIRKREEAVNRALFEENAIAAKTRQRNTEDAATLRQADLDALRKALADAVEAARLATLPSVYGTIQGAGQVGIDVGGRGRALPTREGVVDAVREATGGAGGGDAAGTFDAAMLRFLAGTGNDSLQREQARKQQEQVELLKKVLDVLTRGAAGAVFN